MGIALLAAAALASPALAADQFDLRCAGTKFWSGTEHFEQTTTPIEFEVRIDLKARRYCIDRCEEVGDIERIAPDAIYFERRKSDPDDPLTIESFHRDRREYELLSIWTGHALALKVRAVCQIAPFKGFA